jgi:cytochrome P450
MTHDSAGSREAAGLEQQPVDLAWVRDHFNPADQRLVGEGPLQGDGLWTAVDLMLAHCPVTRTDGQFFGSPNGSWIVNRYDDIVAVMHDPELFSNRIRKGHWEDEPVQIPFDIDPPLLLEYRRILQPHLTIKSVAKFEPRSRELVNALIDEFIESGRTADAVSELCHPFSTQVQMGYLVGIDSGDHRQVLRWVLTFLHGHLSPEFEQSTRDFVEWIEGVIARRRTQPRQEDLIDSLLHPEVMGHPLSDDEMTRIMLSMIIGGVTATADAISNFLYRLAVYPALQDEIAADLAIVPKAIEEFLRIEPSSTGSVRRCTRDTVLGGQTIKAGEQLLLHNAAANRDPDRFTNPAAVDFSRDGTPHLTFGAGYHRCLGSNFARLNLRVVLETVITRLREIRLAPADPPRRIADLGWMVEHLPLTYRPGLRVGSAAGRSS